MTRPALTRPAFALGALLLAAGPAGPAGRAFAAGPAGAPASKPPSPPRKRLDRSPPKQAPERPLKITADSFEVLAGNRHATWKGHVVAVRDDMTVTCKALVADYDDQNRIKKLTCTGDAHMRQVAKADRPEREVWGEVAVFDVDTAVLTVTGSPRAREGTNTMRGEKVSFDSNADKLRVERVSMVIDTPPDQAPPAGGKAARPAPDAGAGEAGR